MVVPPIVAATVARIFFYADLQRRPRVQATIIYNASSRPALVPAVGIGIGNKRNGLYITEDRDIMHRTTNSCIAICCQCAMIVYQLLPKSRLR